MTPEHLLALLAILAGVLIVAFITCVLYLFSQQAEQREYEKGEE